MLPVRIVAQSVKRACLISRDFEANQRWRFRNGTSACRSSVSRVPVLEHPFPVDADEQRGQAGGERRVRIFRRARRHLRHLHRCMLQGEPVRARTGPA